MNTLNVAISHNKRLVGFEADKTLELGEFVKRQKEFVEGAVSIVLKPWEESCREIVEKAVDKCLNDGGFGSGGTVNGEPVKLSFTEQAARRTECRKLSRFAKLADYMIVSTLQFLVISSVQDLLKSAFTGCIDDDVAIDESGVGTIIVNENGVIQGNVDLQMQDEQSDRNFNTGVQVGGVVVGREVGTSALAQCGFAGFSDILSRIIVSKIDRITLVEVIEEEGPLPEMDLDEENLEPKIAKRAEDSHKWKGGADKVKIFVPLFRTELLMNEKFDSSKFYFASSLPDYLAAIDILLKVYLSTVEQVGQLTYTIKSLDTSNLAGSGVRGLDDPEFGDGPQVGSIVLEGGYFKELCGRIRGVFVGMFGNASKWLDTLDSLQQMWLENQSFNGLKSLREQVGELAFMMATVSENNEGASSVVLAAKELERANALPDEVIQDNFNLLSFGSTASRNEDGLVVSSLVAFFDALLNKFAEQKATMDAIPARCTINNLLIDCVNLKSILVPSPERCFNEVARLLPGLARNKNELLLTEMQSWIRILNAHPTTVEAFVEYLGWLEKSMFISYNL